MSQKHVCDGIYDCLQGEDEINCPAPKPCNANSKCEQICIRTHDNQDACACRVGYVLSENKYK